MLRCPPSSAERSRACAVLLRTAGAVVYGAAGRSKENESDKFMDATLISVQPVCANENSILATDATMLQVLSS